MNNKNIEIKNISPEKLVIKRLQELGALKEIPGLKVKDIGKGIVLVEREGNVKRYYKVLDGKVEVIFNIAYLRDDLYFKNGTYKAGYREIKDSKGVYNMYSLKDIDFDTGNPKVGVKPVDIHSQKYFEIWININFFESKLMTESFKLEDKGGGYTKMSDGKLERKIDAGALRIADLISLVDEKRKVITKEQFNKYLPILQSILLSQIGDSRFEKLGESINEREIKFYVDYGYITKDLARECYRKLRELEEIKQKKEKGEKEIHSKTHFETQEIQTA
ncbi:MAG: hypothetical protein PHZ26_01980 [Candidatus Gracilibacteria bacterium]|nr:hypothetical protein [Candidatus Gracilibacteria bacterium]MDD2908503.1 hypothetical protein [Candidatus Gracilibacteria bacterium]